MAAVPKISAAAKLIFGLRGHSYIASRPASLLVSSGAKLAKAITNTSISKKKKKQKVAAALVKEKRRTRSDKEFDKEAIQRYGDSKSHIPVMLAEVLDVFSCWRPLHSFVDCTVGAAGHSSAIVNAHPEMKLYVGMDVDPVAYEKARAKIDVILHGDSCCSSTSDLRVYTEMTNFRNVKSVLGGIDKEIVGAGVDGILMDLGMSSMQVDNPERGFSSLGDGPLDMRMDPRAYDRQALEQKTY